MEQHPVPQNVTTFQFRLIGDMTIKQFGYLAGGVIMAYVSYKLPLPFFFTWPMALIFALGGFGFAFVPVEERPMDIWVLSFLKSVYSPTHFIWQKAPTPVQAPVATAAAKITPTSATGGSKSPAEILGGVFGMTPPRPQAAPQTAQTPHVTPVQAPQPVRPTATNPTPKKPGMFDWIAQMFVATPQLAKFPAATTLSGAAHVQTPSVTGKHFDVSPPPVVSAAPKAPQQAIAEVEQKEVVLEGKLHELKKELENKTMTEARILELQKQLTEVLAQKDKMETEVIALRKQAATPPPAPAPAPAQVVVPTAPPAPPAPSTSHVATPTAPRQPTVKIITPEGAVKAGLPRLTTFPNVVTGITKDSENNFLPGVLITVKDKDGMPLRALKTNRLGQFAASTPLANGVYFVEIEDPRGRFNFDRVQITLNGSIVPALEIIAKSQKEINRAQLEKELFGNKAT